MKESLFATKGSLEQIEVEASKIQEYLKDNHDPYCKVVITTDGVFLERIEQYSMGGSK